MSSLKFSYWSSPQTSTKSGLKSSRIFRMARKSLPKRSPQRLAAPRPPSLPSSASISFGQFAGFLRAASTLGASSVRLKTPVSPSFGKHKVGQWVTPSPRISAICLFLSLVSATIPSRPFQWEKRRHGDAQPLSLVDLFWRRWAAVRLTGRQRAGGNPAADPGRGVPEIRESGPGGGRLCDEGVGRRFHRSD